MKKKDCPLVSVIVVTYNSSATVLETLDSIKNQIYKNIELIISDDCSTDNTQSVIKEWLENNRDLLTFKRAILINTPVNGGPAVNCNNGIRYSKGEWYKLIAGDDILLPDCIKKNVDYVTKHRNAQIVFSKITCFSNNDVNTPLQDYIKWNFWKLKNKQQYLLLLLENQITAPSQFVSKKVWEKLQGYDVNIPYLEDWPFWIKAFKNEVKFAFFNEPTVKYRVHESLSNYRAPSKKYLESLRLAKEYAYNCQYEISTLFRFYDYTKNNIHSRIIQKFLFICNPYYWYIKYVQSLL